MPDKPLKDIRNALTEKTIDILASYRKNVSQSHPPGQLVLPEQLKEFSMYILSLLKCRAFKGLWEVLKWSQRNDTKHWFYRGA